MVVQSAHVLLAFAVAGMGEAMRSSLGVATTYEAFLREFSIQRNHKDPFDYHTRAALFEKRRQEVREHNSKNLGWLIAINQLSDYTEEEFKHLLGHSLSRRGRKEEAAPSPFASLLELAHEHDEDLAQQVDWRESLNSSTSMAKDQGGCGSCWAVAAAGALETHVEQATKAAAPEVSYEQLVDCVPNPEECGGTGGCSGATAELAFEYVAHAGVGRRQAYKGYQSGGDGKCNPSSQPAIKTSGFVKLPENQGGPLLQAIATQGPVVVSADASNWASYSSGVFSGCGKDAIINHAILMMGYGTDPQHGKYWLIRNSWGPVWGEGGFIRLLRHEEDNAYCGIDRKPSEGVGCRGGPAELPVCGMCGITSDSSYPKDVEIVAEQ